MTRNELSNKLFDGKVVTFTKKDGTIRVMRCTTDIICVPEHQRPKGESKREPNPDVVNVWDLEKLAWRSIRVDSVISVEDL